MEVVSMKNGSNQGSNFEFWQEISRPYNVNFQKNPWKFTFNPLFCCKENCKHMELNVKNDRKRKRKKEKHGCSVLITPYDLGQTQLSAEREELNVKKDRKRKSMATQFSLHHMTMGKHSYQLKGRK